MLNSHLFDALDSTLQHALSDKEAKLASGASAGARRIVWGLFQTLFILAGLAIDYALIFDLRTIAHLDPLTGKVPENLMFVLGVAAAQGVFAFLGFKLIAQWRPVRIGMIAVLGLASVGFAASLVLMRAIGDLPGYLALLNSFEPLTWAADAATQAITFEIDDNLMIATTIGIYAPFLLVPLGGGLIAKYCFDNYQAGVAAIGEYRRFKRGRREVDFHIGEAERHAWDGQMLEGEGVVIIKAPAQALINRYVDVIEEVQGLLATQRFFHTEGEPFDIYSAIHEETPDARARLIKNPEELDRFAREARTMIEDGLLDDEYKSWLSLRNFMPPAQETENA